MGKVEITCVNQECDNYGIKIELACEEVPESCVCGPCEGVAEFKYTEGG